MKLSIQNAYTGLYQFSITTVPAGHFVHSSDFHELMPECIGTLSMDSPKSYYNENHSKPYPAVFSLLPWQVACRRKIMRSKMLHFSAILDNLKTI